MQWKCKITWISVHSLSMHVLLFNFLFDFNGQLVELMMWSHIRIKILTKSLILTTCFDRWLHLFACVFVCDVIQIWLIHGRRVILLTVLVPLLKIGIIRVRVVNRVWIVRNSIAFLQFLFSSFMGKGTGFAKFALS